MAENTKISPACDHCYAEGWAKAVRPRVICLENVEEFRQWGPLDASGRPCPQRIEPREQPEASA